AITWITAITQGPGHIPPPVLCSDRFGVAFPDFGNDVSLDNNASLRSLAVAADGAGIGLSPAFASRITAYAATVPFATQSVTITPAVSALRTHALTVAQDGGAPITVASWTTVPLALPA